MSSHKKILIALFLTIFFLALGTLGYVHLEKFSPLDAFYMTVITVSTVGFGEINQLTGIGRVFTIFLILSGVGSIAFAIHAFTESLIEKASNPNSRKKAMKKKIEKLQGHYIICGHGRVGAAAANQFRKMGADFVVIESSEAKLLLLEEEGYLTVLGDATNEKTLLDAGIKKADALLALLDSDPENLFVVLTAREMNPTLHIISRTATESSEARILRAGADSVISPYSAAGKRVADKILSLTKAASDYQETENNDQISCRWLSITTESAIASLSVEAAETKLNATIIGVRRGGVDSLLPEANFQLRVGDEVYISQENSSSMGEPLIPEPQKIVLIDDNPVIRQLYNRLFQKAGYHICTAKNGQEGLEMILQIHPDAAVIDYMLPDISGLEVCRRIRAQMNMQNTKLVLFTADDQEKTSKKALEIGVEKVVLKSPEASEIISIVGKVLEK
jgi:voltage-gated potassium channel